MTDTGREPELDVDEPACGLAWATFDDGHACELVLGHSGVCECHCGVETVGAA